MILDHFILFSHTSVTFVPVPVSDAIAWISVKDCSIPTASGFRSFRTCLVKLHGMNTTMPWDVALIQPLMES